MLLKLQLRLEILDDDYFFGNYFGLKTLTLIFFVVRDRDQSPSQPQKKALPLSARLQSPLFDSLGLALREKDFIYISL